jgi:ankyrin repeat protein
MSDISVLLFFNFGSFVSSDELFNACCRRESEKVKSILINNPSLLNEELNESDWTALYLACYYNDSSIVSYLLEQQAIDVNKSDKVNDYDIIIADVSHSLVCYPFLYFCSLVILP